MFNYKSIPNPTPFLLASLLDDLLSDLNPKMGGGAMTVSYYDTAWMAMLRNPATSNELLFPQTIPFLLAGQAPDGSWSGEAPNSFLPTMAALLALHRLPEPTTQTRQASRNAENYLRDALPNWAVTRHESVGFEVLAPYLLDELASCGVNFIFPGFSQLMQFYHEKIKLSGVELIYTGGSNLIHSLEAFICHLDLSRLKPAQAANGSFGCSPAATAAYLMHQWDDAAYSWLNHLLAKTGGGVPNAYPIDAFEISWVLYNLQAMGHYVPEPYLSHLTNWLTASLTPYGGSISRLLGLPTDSDDTGVIIAALKHAGVNVSVEPLLFFERENHFACFERERGISLSANAHVLAALLTPYEITYSSQVTKLVDYLYRVRHVEGYWEDKWHVSPYYATASCVLALNQHPSIMVRKDLLPTIRWVLATQSAHEGGWGYGNNLSLEETAYALQILKSTVDLIPSELKAVHSQAISRGISYIQHHLGEVYFNKSEVLPKMWRGKELYTPIRVVVSAILSVL
jgi:halimadienyl-diphosphate synthase